MRTPRIFSSQPLPSEGPATLDASASRHLIRVLRLREGDEVTVFDGTGGEHHASITAAAKDAATVELKHFDEVERESALFVRLVYALPKGEKADWVIQKATELGVAEVQLVSTERTVVRLSGDKAAKRLYHWRGVAISACEQSGRNTIPVIEELAPLASFLDSGPKADISLVLHPTARGGLRMISPQPQTVNILIGPEGGFSETEIKLALRAGYEPVLFGPRILRTETAAVAVLAALQERWGDIAG